eukprot:2626744-Ditylum_brightwellii.AAC.1
MENLAGLCQQQSHTIQFDREEDNETPSQLNISLSPGGDKVFPNQLGMTSFPDMDAVVDMPEDE